MFKVASQRLSDIELEPGITVAQLKEMLQAGGYDVKDAKVTVYNVGSGKHVGKMDSYELQDCDCLEFETNETYLRIIPEIIKEKLHPDDCEASPEAEATDDQEGCSDCPEYVGCDCPHKDPLYPEEVLLDSDKCRIVRSGNSINISIND